MSFQALGWAVDQRPKRPADKLLLLGLADRHNTENRLSWPSIAWLAEFSGLNRKTVIAGLNRLQEEGFIADSGLRAGKTKQIIVYKLAFDSGHVSVSQGDAKTNSPKNGTLPEKGPTFSDKGSQKWDTEPIKEPTSQKASPSSRVAPKRKHGCPDDFWPAPAEGTVTAEKTAEIDRAGPKALKTEVERFVAYHQAKGNKYVDWQRCWTTWVTREWKNGNGNSGTEPSGGCSNPMVRAAARREAERLGVGRRHDQRHSGSRADNGGPGAQRTLGI